MTATCRGRQLQLVTLQTAGKGIPEALFACQFCKPGVLKEL